MKVLTRNIKKIVFFLLIMTTLVGCAGIADWEYRGLPGECEMVRLNTHTIYIFNGVWRYIHRELCRCICDRR